jgi:hypothetical protein
VFSNSELISDPDIESILVKEEDALIILLGGGTKKRQQRDIENARMMWKEYKARKGQEG